MLLVVDPETGDTFYTGPLEAGIRLAQKYRIVSVEQVDGGVLVGLGDSFPSDAEWGCGPTEEIAWRFALGAMFGPIDSEYDEDSLREEIRKAD